MDCYFTNPEFWWEYLEYDDLNWTPYGRYKLLPIVGTFNSDYAYGINDIKVYVTGQNPDAQVKVEWYELDTTKETNVLLFMYLNDLLTKVDLEIKNGNGDKTFVTYDDDDFLETSI